MSESDPEDLSNAPDRFLPPRVEIFRLDISQLAMNAKIQTSREREQECADALSRLAFILREHRASARRIGTPLDDEAVRAILQALRAESYGDDYHAFLQHPDPIEAFLRKALFADLLEEAGKIFYAYRRDAGASQPITLDPVFWRKILDAFDRWLDEL